MRLSDRSQDSWHVEDPRPWPDDILLNGKSQKEKGVFFADARKGLIERFRLNKGGSFFVDKHQKRAISEIKRGRVELIYQTEEAE